VASASLEAAFLALTGAPPAEDPTVTTTHLEGALR
jgi:hypothetical protein